MNEFNDNIQKVINLKDKIEKEITEIDKLYENISNKLKKTFQLKHEKLIKEENDLKEKLQNEVTKIKEKLENYLSESNRLIKNGEKINKGMKNLEKEQEDITQNLSYVSKTNKSQKEMRKLLQELMKSLKITYIEEENNIKYEEYCFNGIQSPNNIDIKDIDSSSFKISWNDNNILNLDNKKLKYKVEIKKENSEDKFKQAFEGNKSSCFIENLDKNTTYEIRICSIYNGVTSNWSSIQKIKTSEYDSIILNGTKREKEFAQKILEWSGSKKMELIYRGTKDGMNCNAFHNKCDNQGPTICLYQNDKGYIFGGYSSISWTNDKDGSYKSSSDCFIFTLTNIHNIEPTKFPNSDKSYSVYHYFNQGPTFGGGHDINICSDFINNKPYCNFPHSYQDILGKGKSILTGDLNNNNKYFKLKEIEVFKLFK